MATEDTLAQIELFSQLPRKHLESLASVMVPKYFKKGELIVREGDLGIGFYAVVRGSVEVFQTKEGRDMALAVLHQNDFFGEMALFDNQVRSASVRALEDCECLVLAKWDFVAEINSPESSVAIAMLPVLARRIRALDSKSHTF